MVRRIFAEWITIPVAAIVTDDVFAAAARVSRDDSRWSPRRAEPGQWLLKGLVRSDALDSYVFDQVCSLPS